MNQINSYLQQYLQRRAHKRQRQAQGQLTEVEAAATLSNEGVLPLATAHNRRGQPIPISLLETEVVEHLLVVAPPGSGQDEQVTQTLLTWPDAALVVDPLGVQYRRSGRFRQRSIGPVYQTPGYRVRLADYYLLHSKDDAYELYRYLMYPCDPAQRPLLDRSFSLFLALACYAHLKQLNPLQVILDGAASPMRKMLPALDGTPEVQSWVRRFTHNLPPEAACGDELTAAAFAAFSHQMHRYQAHFDTIGTATTQEKDVIPPKWVNQRGAVYLTYDPVTLAEIGGLVAGMVGAFVRYHLSYGAYKRLLVILDESVAGHIHHLAEWLRLVKDYGVTTLLTVSSVAAITESEGLPSPDVLLAQFPHQLWYPPNEFKTASMMSDLLGTTLPLPHTNRPGAAFPAVPLLTPTEFMALPKEQALVLTRRERQFRFLAHRIQLAETEKAAKPPPLPPKRAAPVRYLLEWPQPASSPPSPGLPGMTSEANKTPPSPNMPPDKDGGIQTLETETANMLIITESKKQNESLNKKGYL